MTKVFLGLGSNIGKKEENIYKAVDLLSEKIKNLKMSKFYISKAVGYKNQPDFINAAVKGFTDLSPHELLYYIKSVEKNLGRIYRFHWGPREIDIDILFYGELILENKNLIIPHPRLHERDFVLLPLMDLEPNFIHPVFKKSIRDLYQDLKEKSVIRIL